MALETNAFSSYAAVGNKEDVADIIYNVDPHETPFLTMAEAGKAIAVKHEWQLDNLDTPSDSNAQLEGDTNTAQAVTPTVRKDNVCQILKKDARVTGTQEAVEHYGRSSEMDYQIVKRGKALKNDIEKSCLSNNAKVAGDATTARKLGGVEAWLETNVSRGVGGASGGSGLAATDGTQRTFTEAQMKTVLQAAWQNGGNPDIALVGGFNKQVFSTFTGNATRFDQSQSQKLIASIDTYVSDFGELKVVASRHCRPRSALFLQKDMWAVAYLRPIHTEELAKTGDSRVKVIRAECTLEARNEKASAIVADLSVS